MPGLQEHWLGAPNSQWLLVPHPGVQMGGIIGGMHKKLPSPTNPSWQTHCKVAGSQTAPTPQEIESHLSRHFPEMQDIGNGQGLAAEQASGKQDPPGNGFPVVPRVQTQDGPVGVVTHSALIPHTMESHIDTHFPSLFSV